MFLLLLLVSLCSKQKGFYCILFIPFSIFSTSFSGTYKQYCKPNEETPYIHAKSNHPATYLKQLPKSIEARLSNLSSNPEVFNKASKHYQSGYDYKLQSKLPNKKNKIKSKLSTNREKKHHLVQPAFLKERLRQYW